MIEKLMSRSWLSACGLALFIVLLPFQWFRLSFLAERSVIWVAILVLAGIALLTFKTTVLRNIQQFIMRAKMFHAGLVLYILAYIFATLLGDAPKDNLLPMFTVYAQFLLVGAVAENLNRRQIARVLVFALPASFLGLIVYANIVFLSQGTNIVTELSKALATGSHKVVTNRVVVAIVSTTAEVGESDQTRESIRGSIRNFFGNFVSLSTFSLLAFLPLIRRASWLTKVAVAGTLSAGPVILLVILMSRSSILSIMVGLGCGGMIYLLHGLRFQGTGIRNLVVGFVVLALIVAAVLPTQLESTAVQNTLARFTEISSDMRVLHYQAVFEETLRHPWLGKGATELAPDGYQVHNYFLGAWFQIGITGLLVTLYVWCGLLFESYRLVYRRWQQSGVEQAEGWGSVVNIYFASGLLVGPLLRRFIAGDCGRFTLVELFAVALFFLCVGFRRANETPPDRTYLVYRDQSQSEVAYQLELETVSSS